MFPELFSLKGKNALVTGSSRGIGRAIAIAFAEAGCNVIVHGSRESEALKATAAECGGRWIAADLGVPEETARLSAEKADILVLNASTQSYMGVMNFDEAEFLEQCQVNLASSFRLIRDFSAGMCERGWGRIILIGSVNQLKPAPRLAAYSAMKAALASLTVSCAKSFAPYGVTVNNLVPGVVLTDRNTEVLKDGEFKAKVLSAIPAGYFAEPGDMAGAALLLASEAGRYITGIELPVTGGMDL